MAISLPFIQVGLFALFFIACIWGLALGISLRKHLRERHPKIYARFGYPKSKRSGWRPFDWPSSKEEAQVTRADWDYCGQSFGVSSIAFRVSDYMRCYAGGAQFPG